MRVLIVGHGRMGSFHRATVEAEGHEALTFDPLAGIVDFKSWREVPNGFDAAIVAAPIRELYDATCRALTVAKRVLVEKPGAATLQEARDLQALGDSVRVGFCERFSESVRMFRELRLNPLPITYWRVGEPRDDADILLDYGSHAIDLALHLKRPGDPPATVIVERDPVQRRQVMAGRFHADLIEDVLWMNGCAYERSGTEDRLTRQWRAFCSDDPAVATPLDALAVHVNIEYWRDDANSGAAILV